MAIRQGPGRVKGKVALVTGAAQGLGAAIGQKLLEEGAIVIFTDINNQVHETVAGLSEKSGDKLADKAFAVHHDVTSEHQWKETIEYVERNHGRLDILVNNAGIASVGGVEETSLEEWRNVHAIDLDSVFLGCKIALSLMAQSRSASIVNISSISGIVAGHNLAAYNSAKAAVRHLSKSVALDCAKKRNGVRCNSVHPVFARTPILDNFGEMSDELEAKLVRGIPLGVMAEPEDIAFGVLFLASDEARMITGTELVIDGGLSAQ